jgi:hypothetical protein
MANGAQATLAGPDRKLSSAHVTTQQLLDFFATNLDSTTMKPWSSWERTPCTYIERNFWGRVLMPFFDTHVSRFAHCYTKSLSADAPCHKTLALPGPGGWGPDPVTLNNDFYQTLLINGRVQSGLMPELQNNAASPPQPNVRQFPNQFLWRVSAVTAGGGFMLNADMALAVDMAGFMDAANGAVNCSLQLNGTMPDGVTTRPTCPMRPVPCVPASIMRATIPCGSPTFATPLSK